MAPAICRSSRPDPIAGGAPGDRGRPAARTARRRRGRLAAGVVVAATLLAACGASGGDEAKTTDTTAKRPTTEAATTTTTATGAGDEPAGGWDDSAASLSLEEGDTASVTCTPDGTPASIWVTGTYTADSNICTAAVHAGLITVADGGRVKIEVTAGRDTYEGSDANGVSSSGYGAYPLSFTFPKS